ncbi:hypothetical protein B0I37DRAFT_406216 [Chaetomium sp. MPI-CAGE-AT-0009]|nr:hypothetical protein B0I37DRAFT_406216 [Chaetomium sp. MPI-CAGE-AT-0009]
MDNQENQALFPFFPRLPAELRIAIWEESIEPRVVKVNLVDDFAPETGEETITWRVTRIPALLETSIEARQVGLREYKMLWCVAPMVVYSQAAPTAMVYFHPRMDVLGQDFQAVVWDGQMGHVQRPGLELFPRSVEFFDIFRGERPLIEGSLDPFHSLRHIHLNLFVMRTSSWLRDAAEFINNLLICQAPNVLKTVTLKIIVDLPTSPANPLSTQNLQSFVYRIVRRPALPIPNPKEIFSEVVTNFILRARQPDKVPYTDILKSDGAIFTRPVTGNFAVLRVIDPTSDATRWGSAGNYTPFRDPESRYWKMLIEGELYNPVLPELDAWLVDLIGTPTPPFPESPWGICGVNYGMEEAKAYLKITDPVQWDWN